MKKTDEQKRELYEAQKKIYEMGRTQKIANIDKQLQELTLKELAIQRTKSKLNQDKERLQRPFQTFEEFFRPKQESKSVPEKTVN